MAHSDIALEAAPETGMKLPSARGALTLGAVGLYVASLYLRDSGSNEAALAGAVGSAVAFSIWIAPNTPSNALLGWSASKGKGFKARVGAAAAMASTGLSNDAVDYASAGKTLSAGALGLAGLGLAQAEKLARATAKLSGSPVAMAAATGLAHFATLCKSQAKAFWEASAETNASGAIEKANRARLNELGLLTPKRFKL